MPQRPWAISPLNPKSRMRRHNLLLVPVKTHIAVDPNLTITHITTEEGEGVLVEAQPGLDGLVEDELHVLVAAPGEGHHEDPGPAPSPGVGIEHQPGVAEVHLRFLAGLDLDAHRHFGRGRFQAAHEAPYRGVGALVAVVILETLADGLDFHPQLAPADHQVSIGLDRGSGLGWWDLRQGGL